MPSLHQAFLLLFSLSVHPPAVNSSRPYSHQAGRQRMRSRWRQILQAAGNLKAKQSRIPRKHFTVACHVIHCQMQGYDTVHARHYGTAQVDRCLCLSLATLYLAWRTVLLRGLADHLDFLPIGITDCPSALLAVPALPSQQARLFWLNTPSK